MRSRLITLGLVLSVSLATASAASAAMPLSVVGVLHQYCADEPNTLHPLVTIVEQPVLTDRMATFGGTVFVAQYSRGDLAAGTGRMAVRMKIQRADGRVERVGRFVAVQGSQGEAQGFETYPLAVRQGDTVIWKYRLKGFAPLDEGTCVMLIAAIGDPTLIVE